MYAAGKVDYNILEIVNGGVQYRFELGSGEGIVRVGDIYVADGHWHEVKLERDRNNAKITIGTYHISYLYCSHQLIDILIIIFRWYLHCSRISTGNQ